MHPVQVHRNIQENNSNPKKEYQDCTSCRIWGSLFHLGVAGFVAKHYKEMPTKGSKAFIAVFSTGMLNLSVIKKSYSKFFFARTIVHYDRSNEM